MKLRAIATMILSTTALSATAGGFETNSLSTSFMYEKGNYAEFGMSSRSPDVKGTVYAPTGSALARQNHVSLAFKSDISSDLSVGLASYNQGAVQLDYSSAGSPAAFALPVVDLDINALAILVKYSLSDNVSIIGGAKQSQVEDASANIFQSVALPASSVSGASETSFLIGASYAIPKIALRAELVYESDVDFSLDTSNAGAGTGKTTASVPDYMTLNFQSGIAADTLLFGSIRKADWSNHQITVFPDPQTTSSFTDTTTYSLGIGRKINDAVSLLANYSTEPAGSSASTTPLTITNGRDVISLAVRYTSGSATVTAGYSYAKVGDITLTSGLGVGEFTNNTVTGFGIKVGFNF
jgi:long-subunit fatty acid transport protein